MGIGKTPQILRHKYAQDAYLLVIHVTLKSEVVPVVCLAQLLRIYSLKVELTHAFPNVIQYIFCFSQIHPAAIYVKPAILTN